MKLPWKDATAHWWHAWECKWQHVRLLMHDKRPTHVVQKTYMLFLTGKSICYLLIMHKNKQLSKCVIPWGPPWMFPAVRCLSAVYHNGLLILTRCFYFYLMLNKNSMAMWCPFVSQVVMLQWNIMMNSFNSAASDFQFGSFDLAK